MQSYSTIFFYHKKIFIKYYSQIFIIQSLRDIHKILSFPKFRVGSNSVIESRIFLKPKYTDRCNYPIYRNRFLLTKLTSSRSQTQLIS